MKKTKCCYQCSPHQTYLNFHRNRRNSWHVAAAVIRHAAEDNVGVGKQTDHAPYFVNATVTSATIHSGALPLTPMKKI